MSGTGAPAAWWRRIDPLAVFWLVATVVAWGCRGFSAGLYRDASFYVYAGAQVADGNLPYVEVMNRAGPLASLLPGIGTWLGRLVGLSDTMGARLLFFALVATAPALLYLAGRDIFRSRLAGCAAAATLVCFQTLIGLATKGPESKLAMMAGLALALMLLARRSWLLAGVVTGLVTLTWQPALFALAPAAGVLVLLDPGTVRERLVSAVRYGAGGLVTLVVTVAWFGLAGELDAFIEGFYGANAGYTTQAGILDRPLGVWGNLTNAFGWTAWLIPGGSLAALVTGIAALRSPREGAARVMLAVAALGGIVWSGFAFNRGPDALLLLPAAALGVGAVVGALAPRVRSLGSARPRQVLLGVVAAWAAICLVTATLHSLSIRTDGLTTQQQASDAVFDRLPADATVFTSEVPQPLALTGRKSISRFVLFGHGMRDYIDATTPGGFKGYVDSLIEAEPDVVLVATDKRNRALQRMLEDYDPVGFGPGWRVFLRSDLDEATKQEIERELPNRKRKNAT